MLPTGKLKMCPLVVIVLKTFIMHLKAVNLLLSGVITAINTITEWLILANIYWLGSNNKNYQS